MTFLRKEIITPVSTEIIDSTTIKLKRIYFESDLVKLSFFHPSAIKFDIYRKLSTNQYVSVASNIYDSEYVITGLDSSIEYTFVVLAHNSHSDTQSPNNNGALIKAKPISIAPISPVSSVYLSSLTSKYVIINWDPVSTSTHYLISVENTNTSLFVLENFPVFNELVKLENLQENISYIAYIKAANNFGDSTEISSIQFKLSSLPPLLKQDFSIPI